jgi:hypothetical protein
MRRLLVMAVAAACLIAVIAAPIVAGEGGKHFKANLNGFQETPQTLSVAGTGNFDAKLKGETLTIELTYSNLTGPATMAHIHLGAPATTGGIAVWLCDSAAIPAPAPLADCPGASGQVNLVVGPTNVVGPTGQGLAPGEWDELIRAIRAGATYANVHTVAFPPGEIRGRITRGDGN